MLGRYLSIIGSSKCIQYPTGKYSLEGYSSCLTNNDGYYSNKALLIASEPHLELTLVLNAHLELIQQLGLLCELNAVLDIIRKSVQTHLLNVLKKQLQKWFKCLHCIFLIDFFAIMGNAKFSLKISIQFQIFQVS